MADLANRATGEVVRALDGVSLKAGHGTLTALVGPDGAGKTTLIRLVAGLMAPDSGALKAVLDDLLGDTNIAGGEIWIALDPAGMPVSEEEKLRGGDKKIKACLMVDTLHQSNAETLGKGLSKQFPGADVGVFGVLSQIGRGDL